MLLTQRSAKRTPAIVNRTSKQSKIADQTLAMMSDLDHQLHPHIGENGQGRSGDLDNCSYASTTTKYGGAIKYTTKIENLKSIRDAEEEARKMAITNPWILLLVNSASSLYVFATFLVSLESALGVVLSVGATLLVYYINLDKPDWNGTMDTVILTFTVITPMSVSIAISFARRDRALHSIAVFRSHAYQLYLSHACWDWGTLKGGGGRGVSTPNQIQKTGDMNEDHSEYWRKHSDEAMGHLIGMADELCRFLTLPCFSRARHRVTRMGRREATRTVEVSYRLFDSLLTKRMAYFTLLTERLKLLGLPVNEASRVRQWERNMGEAIEELRMLKSYRTPQSLRSFARLFTVLLPPFYAPTFAQLAYDMNSLGIGIAFAVITSLALTALFESIYILEDPFVAHLTLDGIDVHEELKVLHWHQLVNARHIFFPSAPPFGEVNDDADTNSQLEDESTESELFQEDKIPQELVIPQEAVISEDDLPTLRPKIKKNALVEISGHFATGSSSNRMSSYEVEHPSFLDDLHIDHEGQWLEINKKEQTQASPPAN